MTYTDRDLGFETINGSLGHGLGVGCGIAKALKIRGRKEKVFVLSGDGELCEGSVWEAVMFGSHHMLDNLILIVDNNRLSMLDYCEKIIKLDPLDKSSGPLAGSSGLWTATTWVNCTRL